MYMMYIKGCCLCLCLYYWSGNCSFGSRSQVKWTSSNLLYKVFFIKQKTKNNIPPATRLKVNLANLFGKNKAWLTAGNDIHHRAGESNRGPLTSPKNTKGQSFFFKTENFNTYMITHNPFPLLDPHLDMLVLDLSISGLFGRPSRLGGCAEGNHPAGTGCRNVPHILWVP